MAPTKKTVLAYKISAVIAGAALSWTIIHSDQTEESHVVVAAAAPSRIVAEEIIPAEATEPLEVLNGEAPSVEPETVAPPQRFMKTKNWGLKPKGTGKVPKQLVWTEVPEAEKYGIEISQSADFAKANYFVVQKNFFPIEVFPGKTYYWRVKALDSAASALSGFSESYSFTAPLAAPSEEEKRVPAAQEPQEEFAGEIPGIDFFLPEQL